METKASYTDQVTARERRNRALSLEAATEGIVLLENKGVLPLEPCRIALYGAGADYTIKGGSGSGEVNVRRNVSVLEGLEEAGFDIATKEWIAAYDRLWKVGKSEFVAQFQRKLLKLNSHILAELMAAEYRYPAGNPVTAKADGTDTCIYVLSRQSGEGHDRRDEPGSFRLNETEIRSIRFCAANYDRFILVINTGAPIDLSQLDGIEGIGAVVYMGQLGMEGGRALATILTGRANPSGKLAVSWPRSYEDVPFGDEYGKDTGNALYKEGVFVGYRYYDSFGIVPRYPFGYGLSYSQFTIKAVSARQDGKTLCCKVSINNTGKVSGKEVVQLYARCNGPDRPYQQLVAFAKSPLLNSGQSCEMELDFPLEAIAVYNEQKAETVLNHGTCLLCVGNSSANTEPAWALEVEHDIVISRHKNLCASGSKIQTMHHDNDVRIPSEVQRIPVNIDVFTTRIIDFAAKEEHYSGKTEAALEKLSARDYAKFCAGTGLFGQKKGFRTPGAVGHTTTDYLKEGIPNVEMCDGPAGLRIERQAVQYPSGDIKAVDMSISLYEFLPRFLLKMFVLGNPKKGKMLYQYVTGFPVEAMVAQTWNTELAERIGRAVSEEMTEYGVTFWLAPALNIVRNPLCGRNYEYFSEDPLISGKMSAAITRGVQAIPGNYVTIKHFAANNQEDNRYFVSSDVDEKVLREIYWKGFEIAVKESAPKSVMTAYNKINGTYCANSHGLCTDLLRAEWGFDGLVMTDWLSTGKDRADESACIRSGVDIIMPGGNKVVNALLKAYKERRLEDKDLRRACGRVVNAIIDARKNETEN